MSAKYKILVVDDEPQIARKTAQLIQMREPVGEVLVAMDERQALDVLARHFVHAALIDMNLTNMQHDIRGGVAVLTAINNLREGTQSVMFSGTGLIEAPLSAQKAGEDLAPGQSAYFDYVIKQSAKDADVYIKPLLDAAAYCTPHFFGRYDALEPYLAHPHLGSDWSSMCMSVIGLNADTFSNALRRAFGPLLPVLPPRNSNAALKQDRENGLLHGQFWSRMLGEGVEVLLGRKTLDLTEFGTVDASQITAYSKGPVNVLSRRRPDLERSMFVENTLAVG